MKAIRTELRLPEQLHKQLNTYHKQHPHRSKNSIVVDAVAQYLAEKQEKTQKNTFVFPRGQQTQVPSRKLDQSLPVHKGLSKKGVKHETK